ncbi:hypothetical protein [Natrinema salsiterrestre]|uniref:ArsR family transcriptional regulator n=1 Tax=Natrinema salsiterrestre TaxID=2950540 RepID=A0A9Q4L0J2_9EURY|nr:hypothetical protein [Natrinema salsiterrestre]MDF9747608.1 hypothetical protein [Natrinema salsiterrestre]
MLDIATLEMIQATDKMFDALADGQRRRLLFTLIEDTPQTDLPIEHDSPPDTSKIEYQHCHLPKLDEYGFINWQQSINAVEQGPRFEEIKPLLEILSAHLEVQPAE